MQNLGLIILITLISLIIFTLFLNIMEYPGGAVGMAPFLLLYSAGISLIPTTILTSLLRVRRVVRINDTVLIFLLSYTFIAYFYLNVKPFDRNIEYMYRHVNLWTYLSEAIPCVLIITFNKIKTLPKNT